MAGTLMPSLKTIRFTHPKILRSIHIDCLVQWLAPAREYLASRGVMLPEAAPTGGCVLHETGPAGDGIDYDRMAEVFLEPDEGLPAGLAGSLYLIDEMADAHGMDSILEAEDHYGVRLEVGEEPSPADVAVRAWLACPQMLEELHNQHHLSRPRCYLHFLPAAASKRSLGFVQPDPARLAALEARFNEWFSSKKRGRGCRVFVYQRETEFLFLVRHGLPCKREGTLSQGETGSVFYRPQKHDLVAYDVVGGELRMNCCPGAEVTEFLRAFGGLLFNNEEHFRLREKYDLRPILEVGPACLVCSDVVGIERVTLVMVEFVKSADGKSVEAWKSEDIYRARQARGEGWPEGRLRRATFKVKFAGSKRPRRMTVVEPNKVLYGRDEDQGVLEQWLRARGFMVEAFNGDGVTK